MITTGTEINHDRLGVVRLIARPASRHISARWKEGKVICNVPGIATIRDVEKALDSMAERLCSRRPELTYRETDILEFEGWKVRFTRLTSRTTDRICVYPSATMTTIGLPAGFNFDAPDSTQRISSVLCMTARSLAPSLLIPRAQQIATQLDRHPARWKISHGHRVLGCCNSRHEISLSYMNAFLPAQLRDYIICHEIAHLTEMNHSARFHDLCDRYCGGREKQLIGELRRFRWPVLK